MVLKNSKGFSLLELMVTLGISLIIVLMAGQGLLDITRANVNAQSTANELREDQTMAHALTSYLGKGIEVDWTDRAIANIDGGRGKIRIFTSGFTGPLVDSEFITLAAFLREAGTPDPSNPRSDLRATGIYFKNPSVKTSGQLVISSSEPGFGAVTLSSHRPAIVFDSIVQLEIKPGMSFSQSGDPVRLAHLRVTTRRFTSTKTHEWHWCPPAEARTNTSCDASARYVDTIQNLLIPLANNAIQNDFGEAESLYGDIYFFQVGEGK